MPSDRAIGLVKHSHLVRSCTRETVTYIVVKEGAGTVEDPVREVGYWYTDDGWLIARRNGWEESAEFTDEMGG